jgi:hypothetical protein
VFDKQKVPFFMLVLFKAKIGLGSGHCYKIWRIEKLCEMLAVLWRSTQWTYLLDKCGGLHIGYVKGVGSHFALLFVEL